MRRIFLYFLLSLLSANYCASQEWMQSLAFAQKLALTQDKLLFVMWENSNAKFYPINIIDVVDGTAKPKGEDFKNNDYLDQILWTYFVPVRLQEDQYEALFADVKGKYSMEYINKFNDDGIKIMDANGRILNVNERYGNSIYLDYINRYAINTSYVKQHLKNYKREQNFSTTYLLALFYGDMAIKGETNLWEELTMLARLYLNEAKTMILHEDVEKQNYYNERAILLEIQLSLMLNEVSSPKRALKKLGKSGIEKGNLRLYNFNQFLLAGIKGDVEEYYKWKPQISEAEFKKANKIINHLRQ